MSHHMTHVMCRYIILLSRLGPFFHFHSLGQGRVNNLCRSFGSKSANPATNLQDNLMGDGAHHQDVAVYVLDTLPDTLADDGADSDGWEMVDSSPTVAHDPHVTHVAGGGDGGDGGDSDDGMLSVHSFDSQGSGSEPPSRGPPSRTTSSFVTTIRMKPLPKAPWDHMS